MERHMYPKIYMVNGMGGCGEEIFVMAEIRVRLIILKFRCIGLNFFYQNESTN